MTRPFYPKKSELPLLLDGRMTAIVRPVKNQPEGRGLRYVVRFNGTHGYEDWHGYPYECPFGNDGDILWCKEQFQIVAWDPYLENITFKYVDGKKITVDDIEETLVDGYTAECCGDADRAGRKVNEEERVYIDCEDSDFRIRQAISMPKSACRLWLQVLEVKVCKLMDLNNEEMYETGVRISDCYQRGISPGNEGSVEAFNLGDGIRWMFYEIFDEKFGKRKITNPWIWYATVIRIDKP